MSAPELPAGPDGAVLARVLDGLRSLPDRDHDLPDDASAPAAADGAVPLPRRRRADGA